MKTIAPAFDFQPRYICHALEKDDAIPRGYGEHPAVEEDIEQQLIDWITKNAQSHTAVNRTELFRYWRQTFTAMVTAGWADFLSLPHKHDASNRYGRLKN
jgi:hypothetical protein